MLTSMRGLSAAFALSAIVLTATPALAESAPQDAPATTASVQTEHDKLFALFDDADARELALNPLSRLFRGEDEKAGNGREQVANQHRGLGRAWS